MYNHSVDQKSLLNVSSPSHTLVSKQEQTNLEEALHILEVGNFEQQWAITKVLVKYGARVILPLKEVILNPQAHLEHRCFALRILSQLKNPQIVLIVTELLMTTQEEELITLATQTLAVQGKESIAFLSKLLDDENYRLLACKALTQIPHRSVIEPLLSVVTDSDYQVRKVAIMALRNFSEPKITQILIMALQDYNSEIRKEALIGLRLKLKANQAIPLIAIISPLLNDFHVSVAQEAAMTLSHCRHPFAVKSLATVLNGKHTPQPLKETVIKSLSWMATSDSIQCLSNFIHVSEPCLTVKIIKILGRIKKSKLKPEIIAVLDRFYHSHNSSLQDPDILQALCYSWAQLKAVEAIPLLQKIQLSNNQQVSFHAQSALKTLS